MHFHSMKEHTLAGHKTAVIVCYMTMIMQLRKGIGEEEEH